MNVVLGVTGGISVYKSCELVRCLKKNNHDVTVMMTKGAMEFVTPLTFETLTQNRVLTDTFEASQSAEIEHIKLAKYADVLVIAPATANIIGKVANGIGDDFVTTTIMATKAPVLFCPAMNTVMYENPIVQKNIQILKRNGFFILEPDSGDLACGDTGQGKLPEVSNIFQKILEMVPQKRDLEGKRVLITAGPTREFIDPVRYLSNRSSGKMGYEIAEEATKRGAEVLVVSGPVSIKPSGSFKVESVTTTNQMLDSVMNHVKNYDIIIFVAAVTDFTPKFFEEHKINKSMEDFIIHYQKTADIAKEVGSQFRDKFLVGFCAETQNLRERAIVKMQDKNLDMMVANDVSQPNAGFEVDTNQVIILDRFGHEEYLPLLTKKETANKILDGILKNLPQKQRSVV